ncbi:response regulator [Cellulophaga sp. HaHaR_3_176]|uniref:response regulator n=1 Tax=Cellulophaga sp. HaHaR_3_176 TaxID=1942464 RepID=UPI001C1F347D|nr:response regulator [Cellulophaga sp. HaHaR_3_176]QWX83503.1 response regulator [Cellulophaga sp. HaHaR_3_176]
MALNICIIDDDLVSQFATQYKLGQSDVSCSISTYDNAKDFLSILSNQPDSMPDIILLDLVMPEMDGWEFLEEFEKKFKNVNNLKIYAISAFGNSKDRERIKNHALVCGYFDKPLSKVNVDIIFNSFI